METALHLSIMIGIYMILSLSLNLVMGYAGLVSIGHAAFYGIGAYVGALLSLRLGVPFELEILLAGAFAAATAYIIGRPILKLRGDHLVLATFGFAIIVHSVLNNWLDLTRGPLGLKGIRKPIIFSYPVNELWSYLILVAVCVAVTLACLWRLTGSPFGKALEAIREDDVAALAVGKDIAHFKVSAFAISAFFAGVAGVLYAHYASYIDPSTFLVDESFLIFSMVVFGGMGSNVGSMVGAVVLVALPEALRFAGLPSNVAGQMRNVILGAVIVLVINWRPQGLLGKVKLSQN
jgi:branched-chain amino acid transport system permease protein